ncbi:patatin-like phospholipase family protein [Arthrobacter sp. MMS18-M83]|uniref:patatin-like phospholipase family protein n=1 Tax=Arthrobacter sp. MMS18-M83 TaxID=2996261 RepID=UPI00227BCFF2|nr:patatin-like phospholipase family protein [Arthrobacter sp. MMS18-M83]WAH98120.1 hypothetical protein OW521_04350 [Arthrobacter sp. MMS18-M83]
MISTERSLVLAGGGVAGIAWQAGFLLGHQDAGLVRRLLTHSTTLLGTSAGSTVAAQIATGNTLQQLLDRQVTAMTAELNAAIDLAQPSPGKRIPHPRSSACCRGGSAGLSSIDMPASQPRRIACAGRSRP